MSVSSCDTTISKNVFLELSKCERKQHTLHFVCTLLTTIVTVTRMLTTIQFESTKLFQLIIWNGTYSAWIQQAHSYLVSILSYMSSIERLFKSDKTFFEE